VFLQREFSSFDEKGETPAMICLDTDHLLSNPDHNFARAVHFFQTGALEESLDALKLATATYNDPYHKLLVALIRQLLASPETKSAKLIWQINPGLWEGDWLKFLLENCFVEEIVDMQHKVIEDFMIVVDNKLDTTKETYYRTAFEAGAKIILFHLSDESFRDHLACYKYCQVVFRNYWSPILSGFNQVYAFPLGYKIGFETNCAVIPAEQRNAIWSFAGDPNKTTRTKMIDNMKIAGEGKLHLTSGFHASDNLDVKAYQAFMSDSIFVPCPVGNVNIESFRVYEALECGAIPIVERRPGFDYFTYLLGKNPLPSVLNWEEAPSLVSRILKEDGGLSLQTTCHEWWMNYKFTLASQIRSHIQKFSNDASHTIIAGTHI
jgi:hypothetical protein